MTAVTKLSHADFIPADKNSLPEMIPIRKNLPEQNNLEAYEAMSKDELIQELVKARLAEARLKKGYEVKGDGSIIHYSSKNTR